VKVLRACEATFGCGRLEGVPALQRHHSAKGVTQNTLPGIKNQSMTQIWIKSTEKQFPIFSKDWLKVTLSGQFLKALSCSVFYELI